jgi:hypothetical protein
MVSQNTTVIIEAAFLFRLKTTWFGPFTGPRHVVFSLNKKAPSIIRVVF